MKKRTHHIGAKYTITMVILVAVFFSIIEIFSYFNIDNMVADLYKEMAYQEISYADNALSAAAKKIETVMRTPLYNERFISAVRNRLLYHSEIQGALQQMLYDDRSITRVCIFDTQSTQWHVGEVGWRNLIPQMTYKEICETEWGRLTLENAGRETFIPGDVLGDEDNMDIVSCCKLLNDPRNGENLGIMIASLSGNFLSAQFMDTTVGDYAVVKDFRSGELTPADCIYSTEPLESFSGLGMDRLSIVSIENERTGWSILAISRKSDLTERASFFFITQGVFILAMGGLMFVFFLAISRSITKPIKRLYGMVVDFGRGIYRTDEVFESDEIGDIGNKFVEIMKENEKLTENVLKAQLREKEAEFQFLQAQINPHFIYNVLDSIYWMSRLKDATHASHVAEMAISLSRILRYSVNKNNEHYTTVAQELQLVQHYLQIQNIRYQGKFRVLIDVDDTIMDLRIIKFLLEPFVENAIVHGLEEKPGSGNLTIIGTDLGSDMEFRIIDDGVGVESEAAFYTGYGINNVIERVKRCYASESAGITFKSSPDVGTTVIIRVSKEIALS